MHHPSPYDPGTPRPHHQPDEHLDVDEAEALELGTPVYEGTGLSVRALTGEELDRFFEAHAGQPAPLPGSDRDALRPPAHPPEVPPWGSADPSGAATLGWQTSPAAGPRLAPRGGYGSPGRSALATYRQQRSRERAGWARSAGWLAATIVAAGVLAGVLVRAAGLDWLVLPVGLTAAAAGWQLRFRVSRDTRAWRDGSRGERATARLLRRLHRHGHVVFHDIGIPGTPANADHLVIGPPGVVLVDSKRYAGQVTQTPDGRVWHNQYSMDHTLRALRLETQAISAALGVRVRPVVCVHQAKVAHGDLTAGEVQILPAGRLRRMLRNCGQQLGEADVAALVAHALSVLRPAG